MPDQAGDMSVCVDKGKAVTEGKNKTVTERVSSLKYVS